MASIFLLAVATACGPSPDVVEEAIAQTQVVEDRQATQTALAAARTSIPTPELSSPTLESTATLPPRPTATVGPTPTPGAAGCIDDARFTVDINVPDGTNFEAGTAFTKTWGLRNSGTCDWDSEYELVFISGDQMGAADSVAFVGAVPAETETTASVDFVAPATAGTYSSNWKLRNSAGELFGPKLYVVIVVPQSASATPSPTSPSASTATPTPSSVDLTLDSVGLDASNFLSVVVRNNGAETAGAFKVSATIGNTTVIDQAIAALPSGGTFQLTAIVGAVTTSSAGEIKIDHQGAINETNEGNNDYKLLVQLPVPGESGQVKSDGSTGTATEVGDSGTSGAGDVGYEAFLSWDISSLAGVGVAYATVDLRPAAQSGDPFSTLGGLKMIDDNWGPTSLTSGLYTATSGTVVATYNLADIAGANLTSRVSTKLGAGFNRFQLRFEFATATNGDTTVDKIVFSPSGADAYLLVAYQ